MGLLPKVTIITVVRNSSGPLKETIQSVLDQNYPRLSYLVVDGGSTDGTTEVIRAHSAGISMWISEPDLGIYDAMNKGWAAADSDSFILFLGAGDRVLSLPENPAVFENADAVFGRVWIGNDLLFCPRADFHLKIYNSIHHQGLMIRKELHPRPPFDLRYRLYADFDFNQRLLKQGCRFRYEETFLGYAAPGGITSRLHFRETMAIVEKNFGIGWQMVTAAGYLASRTFPPVRRFRPLHHNVAGPQ